jgi:diadenosine tetraphosphate (Ap4A) HIT family hydrolase
MGCVLCDEVGGHLVVDGRQWRIIRAEDANFPAFYRLIWKKHVAEFSDLTAAERLLCMDGVTAIEQVLRESLKPTKINLASLGNVVPHLHWHVIARFEWDSHFPNPVWGEAKRELAGGDAESRLLLPLAELDRRIAQVLS